MLCWKVGYRVINCKTGEVYYAPKGYYKDSTGEYVTSGSAYDSFGQQVYADPGRLRKAGTKINQNYPGITYRPTVGYPGATKGWHGGYVPRTVSMIRSDGEPVFKYNNSKAYKTTLSSGGGSGNPDDVIKAIKDSCGGIMTRIPLTEEQASKVAPLLTTTPAASAGSSDSSPATGSNAIDVTVMAVPPGSSATDELALQNQTDEPIPGCTNADATNYDGTATMDDGSCELPTSWNIGYIVGGAGVLVGLAMMMRSR